jgi:plastocyanin
MAIQRVTGQMLESNLTRGGFDLAFETDLLYLDVINGRIGVKTDAPGNYALDVAGNTRITGDLTVQGTTTTVDSQNLAVEDNLIVINSSGSVGHNSGVMINRGSEGNNAVMIWDESDDSFKVGTTTSDGSTTGDFAVSLSNIQVATPVAGDDAATKAYVDSQVSGGVGSVTGDNVQLNLPSDSTFGDGAYLGLTASTSVTQAIDDLNETIDNVRAGTYLKSVTFTADSTSISAGDTVTLTITTVPTAGANTRYTITWGDGDTTTGTSDSTPSHTYASGGTFSVTVKAFENDAATTDSSGSFATSTRTDYITVATTEPEVAFAIYAAASGGSPITTADNGSTVYLQNNTTETAGATVTYDIDWGDGSEDAISGDGVAGGSSLNGGSRIAHTYTNSVGDDGSTVAGTGAGDTKYQIRLRLLTHSTANPAVIPKQTTNNFEVYSTHTVTYSVADSTIRGVNEEATSGFPVTFTNDTATNPGSNSDFSATQRYTWNFGEGDANTLVNVGSGSPGDTGQTITNTFNLSSGEQSAGTTQTYTTSLSLANGHTTQPFSANLNIIVEPDVRANIAGTAVTVSTGSSDNQYTLYDHTDLDSNVRSLARFTNTSQNADDYFYDYFDDSSSTTSVTEDGSSAGSIAATIDKDYTGASNGNINFRFRAHGTPDTIEQDDEETLTFVMKAVPSAPAGLDSKSITLVDAAQGTNPHLCAGFDDNTGAAVTLTAGDSLETTVARRYTTTTTIDTSTASNFYDGSTGTLAAEINDSNDGTKAFTTAENETGTFTSLVVSSNVDYDTVDSTYPQRFYLVASAKITKNLSAYSVGVNAQRLAHTTTGVTNYVHVVKDDITATPTTTIGTVTESSAGTYRYISGVPYYNTGFPLLEITGTTVANFTGQAYQDTISPHEVDPGTNQESTSGNVIASNPYSYLDIDNLLSSMLTGPIPNADTGVSSAYTLGTIGVPITDSAVRSIQTIKARSKNANGTGSYSEDTTKIQVYTASLLTVDDEAGGITVSDSLGATFDDDAVRISGLGSLSGDTPSLFDSSNANYYTDHAWSGAVTVAGTNEAIARFGTIKHFTTDLSSGYLPAGPDLATGRSGAQYFTFAFRRTTMANFTVRLSGKVSGCFIAAPGTAIDSASTLNGWLDASITYGGSGVPGADTGNGGNGSNGCAFTSGDRIIDNTTYSNQTFTLTLGSENATNATGNNVLVRFKLESGDSITALSIE